jgi:hypothetical protein
MKDSLLEILRTETTWNNSYIWQDNNKIELRKIDCKYVNWIQLAQNKAQWPSLLHTIVNQWVQRNVGSFLYTILPISFSRTLLNSKVHYYVQQKLSFGLIMSSHISTLILSDPFQYHLPYEPSSSKMPLLLQFQSTIPHACPTSP